MKKIVVGVSGGIDSTLSLILLKERGYEPIAVSLIIPVWNEKTKDKSIIKAKEICKKLNIEHHTLDKRKDFEKIVVSYFKNTLKQNKTPNPCAYCNRQLKIKALFDFAKKQKIDYVATGHYAKIKNGFLYKPKDKHKDQTYGLSFLKKEWLNNLVFPLENLTKEEVYSLVKKYDLDFSKTKQSQDFCYLSNTTLKKYLEKELGKNKGEIITSDNKLHSYHEGLWFYTLGQRKGLGKNGTKYYVSGFNFKKNQLIVNTSLKKNIKEFTIEKINQLAPLEKNLTVKLRYSAKEIPITLELLKNKKAKITLKTPEAVITPGQVCTFYKKNKCLGGGIIK